MALIIGTAKPLREVFGEHYNTVAGKLLGDVCGFLVTAAGLNDDFRTKTRALLAQQLSPNTPPASETTEGSQRALFQTPGSGLA
jgi:hypothetical protein